jgi:hypothetical protein
MGFVILRPTILAREAFLVTVVLHLATVVVIPVTVELGVSPHMALAQVYQAL